MRTSKGSILVTLTLPSADYRIFQSAARMLRRIIGVTAPTTHALMEANLIGRDAAGLADDYLDSIGWPMDKGRVVSHRKGSARHRA